MAENVIPGTDRPITRQRALGIMTLDLIAAWDDWVERRIEVVTFQDSSIRQRRVSVDFTYPVKNTPDYLPDGTGIYLAPLGFLRKRPLIDFDLRDETNRALPLLTRDQNGEVAASVLAAFAEYQVDLLKDSQLAGQPVPKTLFDEFSNLATAEPDDALECWDNLERTSSSAAAEDPLEIRWRERLVTNQAFMALAFDLAANFLVLTPLPDAAGERRILKFSYEEQTPAPPSRLALRSDRVRDWRERGRKRREINKSGRTSAKGRLKLSSSIPASMRSAVGGAVEFGISRHGQRFDVRAPLGKEVKLRLEAGRWRVRARTPSGLIPIGPREQSLEIEEGQTVPASFTYQQLQGASTAPASATIRPSLWLRFWRATGWVAKRVEIATPAVGQGGGYHLEVEAPEGLVITKGTLKAGPSSPSSGGTATRTVKKLGHLLRVHLPLRTVPQEFSGVASIKFRPRTSTIVRAGFLTALFTTAVLLVATQVWSDIGNNAGSVAALLLVVTGGLSAYVARSSESPVTTEVLFGLRLLCLSSGLWSFLAAAIVVLNRASSVNAKGDLKLGEAWSHTGAALWVLVGLSAATAFLLAVAWYCSWRPPEHKE